MIQCPSHSPIATNSKVTIDACFGPVGALVGALVGPLVRALNTSPKVTFTSVALPHVIFTPVALPHVTFTLTPVTFASGTLTVDVCWKNSDQLKGTGVGSFVGFFVGFFVG